MSSLKIENAFNAINADILSFFESNNWNLTDIATKFTDASLDTIRKTIFKNYYKNGIITLTQDIVD